MYFYSFCQKCGKQIRNVHPHSGTRGKEREIQLSSAITPMISQYIVKYYRNMKAWHGLFSTHCKQESSHVVFSELDLSMVLNTLSTERIFLSQDQGIPEAAKNKFIFFQCLFFHRFRVTFMLSPVNSIHVFQSNQISVCILYNQGSFTFFFIIPRTCNRELVQYILN